jgi:hypothetical protein
MDKLTLTAEVTARISLQEEIISKDGGLLTAPPGRVIVSVPQGPTFHMRREQFEQLCPDAEYDPQTRTYRAREADAQTGEKPRRRRQTKKE